MGNTEDDKIAKTTPNYKFVLAPDAKPLTIEHISQMFFGMPFADAVRDIKDNRNGKYDDMWISDAK